MKFHSFLILILFSVVSTTSQDLPVFKVKQFEVKGLNSNQKQEAYMKTAIPLFEEVMNNSNFKNELLGLERIKDPKTKIPDSDKNKKYKIAKDDPNYNLSTEQIIRKLYTGKEFFDSEENDNEADIYWQIRKKGCTGFWKWKKCIRGSTWHIPRNSVEESRAIYTNSWFIEEVVNGDQQAFDLVGHLGHEWSHKFGFLDTGEEIEEGKMNLFPYIFGNIVEKYAKQICKTEPKKCVPQ